MPHTFKVTIKKDLPTTIKEVESTIVENGGKFKGNASKGKFAGKTLLGKIKGEYASLSENEIKITIIKKPFVTSKSKVESAIREYFS